MIAKRPVSRSLFVGQNDRHHAARFAFLFERPSVSAQTFRPSAVLPFCPFRLTVSSADGALPSADSSPNAISHDLSLAQYSHTLEHSVASEKTDQSAIPDSGQQKAMGLLSGEYRFDSSKHQCCVPLVSEDL